jgi:hypothetical protein
VQGLSGVLTHLSKPINVALSKRYRDDPEHVLRARKHMSKITAGYVQEALSKEHVIVQQQRAIESLINMMTSLKTEFSELLHSHRTAARAAVEKLNVLEPNPFTSYPHYDTTDDIFIKAITAMQNHTKVIEHTFIFSERPFDFLVDIPMQWQPNTD